MTTITSPCCNANVMPCNTGDLGKCGRCKRTFSINDRIEAMTGRPVDVSLRRGFVSGKLNPGERINLGRLV